MRSTGCVARRSTRGPCRQPASLRSAAPIDVRNCRLSKRAVIKEQFHLLASKKTMNDLVLSASIFDVDINNFY